MGFDWSTSMGSLAFLLSLVGEGSLHLVDDELDDEVEGSCRLERSLTLSLAFSLVAFPLVCTPDIA